MTAKDVRKRSPPDLAQLNANSSTTSFADGISNNKHKISNLKGSSIDSNYKDFNQVQASPFSNKVSATSAFQEENKKAPE